MTVAASAVLLTGVYGSGKSAVANEMTHLMTGTSAHFAMIDLDYLSWCSVDEGGHGGRVMRRNLASVVSNFLDEGVVRFVLAYAVGSRDELDSLRQALTMPLRVVRLVVPIGEIERRLSVDVTSGRREDLTLARQWSRERRGEGLEDLAVANDHPISAVAREVLEWLGWFEELDP